MTNAANVDLEPIWASLLAKALEGKNVKELLSNVGSGGGAPAAGGAVPAASTGAPAAEAPKEEEKKEEKEEESDEDMVRLDVFLIWGVMLMICFFSVFDRVSVSSIRVFSSFFVFYRIALVSPI